MRYNISHSRYFRHFSPWFSIMTTPQLSAVDFQLKKIYEINDFLPKLKELIDWEIFRPLLSKVREKERRIYQTGPMPDDTPSMSCSCL